MRTITPLTRLMAQRKLTQQELATAIGVSRQAVQRWQSGSPISMNNLRTLSQYFGLPAAYLLGDESETGDDGTSPSGNVWRIRELDVGPNGQRSGVQRMFVDAKWLKSIYYTEHPETLAIYSVPNNAMTPTLKQSDVVLVDTHDKEPDEGLFVVNLNNITSVRRLQRLSEHQIRVICDNTNYERMTVNRASGALQVLGRVVYFWTGNKNE